MNAVSQMLDGILKCCCNQCFIEFSQKIVKSDNLQICKINFSYFQNLNWDHISNKKGRNNIDKN